MLAGLPPAEWSCAWVRDSAYATAALASIGMRTEARHALRYVRDAAPLPSLTRYTGFGVPEQDWNDFGPNWNTTATA